MKEKVHKLSQFFLKSDILWKAIWPFVKTSNYIQYQRLLAAKEKTTFKLHKKYIQLLDKPVVRRGPFKGLRYPGFSSFGSAIFPKILGSYEKELHPIIEKICAKSYSEIIDIGSAEGYYAIGMALRKPEAKVFAFDVDRHANIFCSQMAQLNGVSNRVKIESKCTPEALAGFPFSGKALIISDCEGYEKHLFTEDNVRHLTGCDLLIETHDFVDITISDYLKSLFHETHIISSIWSIDDIIKARSYQFEELKDLSLTDRKEILQERRPAIMEWLFIESKTI